MLSLELTKILGNSYVSLEEILDSKENRVLEQRKIIDTYNLPIISFTLNIPGTIKTFPLAYKAFTEGKKLISNHLKRNHISIEYEKENIHKAGYEAFYAVDYNPYSLKEIMIEIENSYPLGRIFDIDVLKTTGDKIYRKDVNISNRMCFLCNESAHVCSRSKKHNTEELITKIIEIIYEYFNSKFSDFCSSCACRALMYEACTTPKPGLVDMNNSGSHSDMDIYTFIDSASVLVPYFRRFSLAGIRYCNEEPHQLFDKIRYLGMLAEDEMLIATNNVNTHKGLIFSLGIICTALGYLFANEKELDTNNILELCKDMTINVLKTDFHGVTIENSKTNGEKLFTQYGIKGIRGEVANGFPSVMKYGLPVLKQLIEKGHSLNDAGVLTLLNLIANVMDTNIISRSNIKKQEQVQLKIQKIINTQKLENINVNTICKLDKEFIEMNISPGGCADLLSITYMLYFVENILLNQSFI